MKRSTSDCTQHDIIPLIKYVSMILLGILLILYFLLFNVEKSYKENLNFMRIIF